MCQDMQVPLLGRIPLEPQLLLSCEKGKCYATEFPTSQTANSIRQIIQKIVEVSNK